ncbi:peroxisomal membrane protein pex14 [Dispira simplex]|nr:peroxisomal membrane protein pex14 [Dispira simplex]
MATSTTDLASGIDNATALTPSPTTAPRNDLIQSAVRFLADPKVQTSSLEKRRAFLESKGLSKIEIDSAVEQAGLGAPSVGSSQTTVTSSGQTPTQGMVAAPYHQSVPVSYAHGNPPPPYYPPPPPPTPWKEYFIGTIVASGVGYGLYSVTTRYVIPYIQNAIFTDFQHQLDQERERTDRQLETTQRGLMDLQEKASQTFQTMQEQNDKLQKAIENMTTMLDQWHQREQQRDQDIDTIRVNFEDINKLIPETIEKNKDTQSAAYQNIQSEIRSLKTVLLSRRSTTTITPTTPSSSPATASLLCPPINANPSASPESSSTTSVYAARAAAFTNRTTTSEWGVPAWQLASSSKDSAPADGQPATEQTNPTAEAIPTGSAEEDASQPNEDEC